MARPSRITREAILDQAAILLAKGGLAAVTLRAIAARLGVQAPSLARHVGAKGDLVALLSARIFGEALQAIPADRRGAAWLRAYGEALFEKQLATRDIAALLATRSTGDASRMVRAMLAQHMARAGLEGALAHDAQASVQALATGWACFARKPGPRHASDGGDGGDDGDGRDDAVDDQRPGTGYDKHPGAGDGADLRRRFALSLDALICGFGLAPAPRPEAHTEAHPEAHPEAGGLSRNA